MPIAQLILTLVAQYGPDIIPAVKAVLNKKDATVDDVETIFAGLKPYDAFGIPEHPPVNNG